MNRIPPYDPLSWSNLPLIVTILDERQSAAPLSRNQGGGVLNEGVPTRVRCCVVDMVTLPKANWYLVEPILLPALF